VLFIIHIVVGVTSVVASLGLLVLPERGLVKVTSLAATGLAVASGAGLILGGSSVARVCSEAAVLVVFNAGVVVYTSKKISKGAESEVF